MKLLEQDIVVKTRQSGLLAVNLYTSGSIAHIFGEIRHQHKKPLFMPQVIDVYESTNLLKEVSVGGFATASQIITGAIQTSQKLSYIEIYCHEETQLISPEYIRENLKNVSYGSLPLTQEEFDRIRGLQNNKSVFVLNAAATHTDRKNAFYAGNIPPLKNRATDTVLAHQPRIEPHGKFLYFSTNPSNFDQPIRIDGYHTMLAASQVEQK